MTLPLWLDDTFILSVIGLVGGGGAVILTYFLKSRCRTVSCCCVTCERDVLALEPDQVSVITS